MSVILPINAADLLTGRSIESARVGFKARWKVDTTGFQVLKTICAFANDHQNLNGGYIVIGVAESEGRAERRPVGLSSAEIEAAQRWIRGRCKAIQPGYTPILSPETLDGAEVLVVWVPPSDDRPHRAQDGPDANKRWKYWIRVGSETVDAEAAGRLEALIEQTTRVPWDDRVAHRARVEDLREAKVREHLHDVRSALRDEIDAATIYRRMRLTAPVNDHEAPRNVGLLFFSDAPEQWFPGARIEVVQFAADRAGEVLWTGLPRIYRAMAENGSPAPRFDFDADRTWFRATLPAHPEYAAVSAIQDAARLLPRLLSDSSPGRRRCCPG